MDAESARDRFTIGPWLFLRTLALTHLCAFASFWRQVPGLIGSHGILPAGEFLKAVHAQFGASAALRLPTLAWLVGTGAGLHVLCATGVVAALLLGAGFAPALSLVVLWSCYLSLVGVGQVFLGFQWDALLLETTFLAIFLAPWALWPGGRPSAPPRIARWLLLWLLFRLMFLSGVVKLASGDPTWRDLTALAFHFQTQPLPTPVAWWAHHLSPVLLRGMCALMFIIELGVPFLLFAPRRFRHVGASLLIVLQAAIALTGNYAFFNLLTVALCLSAFDDLGWQRLLPHRCTHRLLRCDTSAPARFAPPSLLIPVAAFVFAYTTLLAIPNFRRAGPPPAWFLAIESGIAPFSSLNNYGLFAVMTTTRPELIIEGSDDGIDWRAYELPHKPGDPDRRPDFVAPGQPRLDWQLWFAALGEPAQNPWVMRLCEEILRGSPPVLALFARNPFPDRPPRLLRIVRYDYTFTSAEERAHTGRWWRRTPLDFYVAPVSLK